MVQVPILKGVFANTAPDLRQALPLNLVPVAIESGISAGYLRPGDGLVEVGEGPGLTRAGINWLGVCYRVMGSKLVTQNADGSVTVIGDVGVPGNLSPATLVYGVDRLAIACDGSLYYYSASLGLVPVTDTDLGFVLDVVWIDGYFMATDGEFLAVSDLTDPMSWNPVHYGTAEADPDPVVALLRLRNEVWALNRNTIEVFDNVGGNGFPFQRIEGAQIQKGVVGTRACCVFIETVAFLGSGVNEQPGVYLGSNGNAVKISTPEIDRVLAGFTEAQLQTVVLECRNDNGAQHLYVQLTDRCLVYDHACSQQFGEPVWFVLSSSLLPDTFRQYKAIHFVYAYDKWLCGDPTSDKVGELSLDVSTHYGEKVRWLFQTSILYNEGKGAVVSMLELEALTGSIALGVTPTISSSFSDDKGVTWSNPRTIDAGLRGDRVKPLVFFPQGSMRRFRVQRFWGTSDAHIAFARLEATMEGLAF